MKYSAIIVAAGSGKRMGLGYNKVFYPLFDGKTILEKTMQIFEKDKDCQQLIVVADSEDYRRDINHYCDKLVLVDGGEQRQDSVSCGLSAVTEEVVLIHDGARPYLTEACLERLKNAMESASAAILAIPCKDTIKIVVGEVIEATLPRELLYHAQTPQAFKTGLLKKCYEMASSAKVQVTDDASVVEEFSDEIVQVVLGDESNIKITTINDIEK
ncbi:MAG: 2-C-methyl-D-erythritol 4-phosphate cytidylyltransferase [Anaerorhabdus sp.]